MLFSAIIFSSCQKENLSTPVKDELFKGVKQFPDAEVLKNPEPFIKKIHSAIKDFDQFYNSNLKSTSGDSLVHKSDARILLQGLGNYRHDDFSTEMYGLNRVQLVLNMPVLIQGMDTLTQYSLLSATYDELESSLDSLDFSGTKVYSVSMSERTEHTTSDMVSYRVTIQVYKTSESYISGYMIWHEADEAMNSVYRPYMPNPGEYWAYHSQPSGRTTNDFLPPALATNSWGQYYGTQTCNQCNGPGYLYNSECSEYINMTAYNQLRYDWVNYMEDLHDPGLINEMNYHSHTAPFPDPIIIATYPCYPQGNKHHNWDFKISYLGYELIDG